MNIKQNWNIRQALLEDLEPLVNIFEDYRVWYKQKADAEGALRFLSDRLKQKDSEIFICELGGKIIGFTQLYPQFSSTRMKRLWLLNDLYVDESHRGNGISLGLIDRAKKLAKDTSACGVLLETDKTNDIGNQLYPRAGFELNKHANYYEWLA